MLLSLCEVISQGRDPLANGDLERLETIASLINYRQPMEMSNPRFVEEMEAKRRVATAVGASIFGSETKVKKNLQV